MESAGSYFQTFDEKWGNYIEVEEDAVVTNRDLLMVTFNFITSLSTRKVCVISYGILEQLLPCYVSLLSVN